MDFSQTKCKTHSILWTPPLYWQLEIIMTSIRVRTVKEWKWTSITILSKFTFCIEYQLNYPDSIDNKWQWIGIKSTFNICLTLLRTVYQRCPFAQSLKSQIPPPSAESKDVNFDLFQPFWSLSFLTHKCIGPPTRVAAVANFMDRFHWSQKTWQM